MITIVNYGMGNLGSIANMYKRIGFATQITSDLDVIRKAEKILLPGVGAFDGAMERINQGGFREVLDHKAKVEKVPVLGICLGMQLLTESSEEGVLPGLGWIPGKATRFRFDDPSLKVPHMGWNRVEIVNETPMTIGLPSEPRFYFVHSYYVTTSHRQDAMLSTTFGHSFDSGIFHDNIFGAQFHPEKSHKFGMKFLENFARL